MCFQGKVHEWGPVVVTYLRKQAIPAAEVTSRLTGKAREVVGAGIGRNPVWFRLTAHFSHVKTTAFNGVRQFKVSERGFMNIRMFAGDLI